MAHDWKKNFTPQQLAIIQANTVPKTVKNSIPSCAVDAEQSELMQQLVQSADTSSHSTVKWVRCAGTWESVHCESPICSGFAGKVGGEASSACPISSSTAAKVGMVDRAEFHAVSHGSAAPTAAGVVASIRNSLMPLGLEDEEMIQAAQAARVAHLTKLSETDACDRRDGKILKDAVLQFLTNLTLDGNNKDFFLCWRCGVVAPNHLLHQAKGQHGMKHHLRCSRCNTEYFSWVKDGRFCMRL